MFSPAELILVTLIPEEEQSKYDNYSQRLDVENAETFGQYEFMKACKSMGITQDIK